MRLQKLRQYLLVSEMMGVEGHVCANFILLIANLQTLGVPIVDASLPIVCSSLFSLLMIPTMGYITDRCAFTLRLKALTLVAVNCFQMTGAVLVVLANLFKLSESYGNTTLVNLTEPEDFHMSGKIQIQDSQSTITAQSAAEIGLETNSSGLKFYAIMAMAGYAMADSGYDMSSCYLKTFALASTPDKDHPIVIVKSIVLSSIGGCMVALMGSVGLGEILASSADLDANAVTSVFIYGLCLAITAPTMITTLITGLCCRDLADEEGVNDDDDHDDRSNYDETKDESQSLITESLASNDPKYMDGGSSQWYTSVASDRADDVETKHQFLMSSQSSISRELVNKVWQFSQSGTHSLIESLSNVRKHPDVVELTSTHQGCLRKTWSILKKQEKRFVLCTANFFAVGAIFSFNLYSTNFVATSVFGGDAKAPSDSEKYANYTDGVKAGSIGLMLCYSAFVACTLSQVFLLNKIGWWRETVVVFLCYIVSNVACATSENVWMYYITAVINGIYRGVIFTVPYILVCRVITKDGESDTVTSWDISLVATMLPLSLALFSPAMGPLLEATGDAASPLYVVAISSTCGLAFFSLLRKY